jgi:LysM repeat protein
MDAISYTSGLKNIITNFNKIDGNVDGNKDGKLSVAELSSAKGLSPEGTEFLKEVLYNNGPLFNKITQIEMEVDNKNISLNDLNTLNVCTDGIVDGKEVDSKNNYLSSNATEQILGADIKRNMTSKKATATEIDSLMDTYSDISKRNGQLVPSQDKLTTMRKAINKKTSTDGNYDVISRKGSDFVPNLAKMLTILGYSPKDKEDSSVKIALVDYQKDLISKGKLSEGEADGRFGFKTWSNMMENLSPISSKYQNIKPAEINKSNTQTKNTSAILQTKDYTVQAGDTLSGIAKNNKISAAELQKINGMGKNDTKIFPGDTLQVPAK